MSRIWDDKGSSLLNHDITNDEYNRSKCVAKKHTLFCCWVLQMKLPKILHGQVSYSFCLAIYNFVSNCVLLLLQDKGNIVLLRQFQLKVMQTELIKVYWRKLAKLATFFLAMVLCKLHCSKYHAKHADMLIKHGCCYLNPLGFREYMPTCLHITYSIR